MAFLYLLIAVIAEVLATSALKATNGFTAPLPVVLTIVGYAIAVWQPVANQALKSVAGSKIIYSSKSTHL